MWSHFEKLNDILDVIEERKADLAKLVARVDNDLRALLNHLKLMLMSGISR